MTPRKLLAIAFVLFAALGVNGANKEDAVAARRTALDLAGAFSNDGFKIRDGHWTGTIAPKEKAIIAVNLYAGNEYWFSAGGTEAAKKLGVDIFDEAGNPISAEVYSDGDKAAAGFSPVNSGQYFISVGLLEGEPGSVCLVYSYK